MDKINQRFNLKSSDSSGKIRVYRVEVSTPSYRNPPEPNMRTPLIYPHVFIYENGPIEVKCSVAPERMSTFGNPNRGRRIGDGDVKKRKLYKNIWSRPKKSADEYGYLLQWAPGQTKNRHWLNFGNAERALEFYYQKTLNEPNFKFFIKSFEVPSELWEALIMRCVPEAVGSKYKTRPINVDLKAWNQLGLSQSDVAIINRSIIQGSAKLEDPEIMYQQLDETKQSKLLEARSRVL
jgi:hypothetical protein